MVHMTPGLDDLFAQLDAASTALREQDRTCGRERSDMGILPRVTDTYLASETWRPPTWATAKKEAHELFVAGHRHKPTFCATAQCNTEFSSPGIVRGKILDSWTASRVTQPDKVSNNPKGYRGYCAMPGREMPGTHDDMCSEQHRKWLDGHHVQREQHLHPVYTAVKRVTGIADQVENAKEAIKCAGSPEQRSKLQTKQSLLETRLQKAKSDPVLTTRVPTPEGRMKHLHKWEGPQKAGNSFQQSSPWQGVHEEREVIARGGVPSSTMKSVARRPPQHQVGEDQAVLARQLEQARVQVASLEAALSASRSACTLAPASQGRQALAASASAGALANAGPRPPTGRPPTGAFGTSRATSPMRPRTGTRLGAAGSAVLGAAARAVAGAR